MTADQERAAVVAWLKELAFRYSDNDDFDDLAIDLQDGVHHREK